MGPAGPKGDTGVMGPIGPSNAYIKTGKSAQLGTAPAVIDSLGFPAGKSYVLFAKAVLSAKGDLTCSLVSGNDELDAIAVGVNQGQSATPVSMLAFLAPAPQSAEGSQALAALTCKTKDTTGGSTIQNWILMAVELGSITVAKE